MTHIREHPSFSRITTKAHASPARAKTIAAEVSLLLRTNPIYGPRKVQNGLKGPVYGLSDTARNAYVEAAERLSVRLGQGLKISGNLKRVRLFEALLHQDATLAVALGRAERAERELAAAKKALRQMHEAARDSAAPETPLAVALADARARGNAFKAQLAVDPAMLSTADAAERLGMTQEGVRRKRKRREILGVTLAKRGIRYPDWQFLPDGRLIQGLPRLFLILGDDDWAVYRFLLTRHAELNGIRAVDALRLGRIDETLAAAESMAIGAFA